MLRTPLQFPKRYIPAPGTPVNPALGCCWDAASWALQEHLCEPCHKNSGSLCKSIEMNSRITRRGRILTSWSWVTAVRGQRQLKHNTAVGAGATAPRVPVLRITPHTAPCPPTQQSVTGSCSLACRSLQSPLPGLGARGSHRPAPQAPVLLLRDMLGHLLA